MFIESLEPLRVKSDGQVFTLEPGKPVDLPGLKARRLLDRAPGKVRPALSVGCIVEWESPLFGVLCAPVLEVTSLSVTVQHPLTEHLATIPRAWVKRVEQEPA